jgi:hypothetical protein
VSSVKYVSFRICLIYVFTGTDFFFSFCIIYFEFVKGQSGAPVVIAEPCPEPNLVRKYEDRKNMNITKIIVRD